MLEKNILICVYTNASGFLWNIMKVDCGTYLGYSEYRGNDLASGTFVEYEDALEDALDLISKGSLEEFEKDIPPIDFHWSNFATWLTTK